MMPAVILRFLLPKVLDHLLVVFKLDKVLDYVENPNNLDVKVEELEDNEVATEIFKQNDNTMVGKRVEDIDDVPIELTNRDVVEGYKNK